MKHLKTNARKDLLARAYLDMLGHNAGPHARPLRGSEKRDPVEKAIDHLSGVSRTAVKGSIPPDVAAAAVLLARAVESVDSLARELRRGCPVVSITTHSAAVVPLVRGILKVCAFGKDASIRDEQHFEANCANPVLLVSRDGSGKQHRNENGNEAVAKALHALAPIVGIAPDPRRHLPRDLLRAAEHHLSLERLDASAISLVVEAVTGEAPTIAVDEQLVQVVDISDLALSIRPDRSADDCIRRMDAMVSNKTVLDYDGPSLEDLPGYGAARDWGLELVADLRAYRTGRLDWENIESSLLLFGPPGVGKTQYAMALAKSCNVPIVKTSVADWNSALYLSGTLAAIKDSFSKAKQLAPAVLFVDELDGISDRASIGGEYREYWTQILNLLLEQLSAVPPGVIVVCCTNFPERIDPAVRRAGRLDRTIEIPLPDAAALAKILRYYLGPNLLPGADLTHAALAAIGHTGADVETWVRRARSRARRAQRDLTIEDVVHEIRSGREALPDKLRRVCAVHESGHLIVGVALDVFEPQALSILDHGGTTRVDLSSANAQTEAGVENLITALLGGRAAEEILLGRAEATIGAGIGDDSDFARATGAALDLELGYGLGSLGVVHYAKNTREMFLHDPGVTSLVRKRLDRCHERARALIEKNRPAVEAVAARLQTTGYLDRSEIERLLLTQTVKPELHDEDQTED
ncbi:AAA family ATPase [Bradyrhizobium sp. CCBAU 53338]|uniref:AAA family ATPase n=1 Tax=Bradyrhizobium sp. CCBAU 53338 TaxID=1325111 RepID=UPI001FEFF668|nr:AAA family ATPase [Bradyrhizobium sp. CCBAU 53338]